MRSHNSENQKWMQREVSLGKIACSNARARIMFPKGSSNSTDEGRANTSAFLSLGGVCPPCYSPGTRNYFPVLPSRLDIDFLVGRPQDMPALASRGYIDGFIAFEDLVCEAKEAGIKNIERAIELPFGTVDVVMVAPQQSTFASIGGLLACAPAPIRCVSELPFLARMAFREERSYQERFGSVPPLIEIKGSIILSGNPSVQIVESAGSCEAHVTVGIHNCASVVRSSGRTIERCELKVIKRVGTYHPGFFCRNGLREDRVLGPELNWFVERLELASRRWEEMRRQVQLELPFGEDEVTYTASAQVCPRGVRF